MLNSFIKLGEGTSKAPIEKWSKPEFRYSADKIVEVSKNYAFIPPEGYTVIDADSKGVTKFYEDIIARYNLKPVTWETTRGRHWLFKITKHVPPMIPGSLVGAKYNIFRKQKIDYKGWNKAYVRVSDRVDPHELERVIDADLVPELPLLFYPIKTKLDIDNFPEGERHDIMFRYWIPRLRKTFTNDRTILKQILYEIIKMYHQDPDTIENIKGWVATNVDTSFDKGEIDTELAGKYSPYIALDALGVGSAILNYSGIFSALIKNLKLRRDVNTDVIWGLREGVVKPLEEVADVVKRELMLHEPNIKPSIMSEIASAMPSRVPYVEDKVDKEVIVFNNGMYNTVTGKFDKALPEFVVNKISYNYLTDAEFLGKTHIVKWVMDLFGSWASDTNGNLDKDIIYELFEIIGFSMTRDTTLGKMFILFGNASNGKSVFLKLLEKILGAENTASEDLKNITDSLFSSSQLYGKLANINGDISSFVIKDPSTFKKLVTGDRVSAQYKGKPIFQFEPYATIVLGANTIPYVVDGGDSDAIDRRMDLVHFRNKFKASSTFRAVEKYLMSKEVIEVIIKLSLDRYHKIIAEKDGNLTISKSSKKLREYYLLTSDHVFEYLDQIVMKDGTHLTDEYTKYKTWADRNDYMPLRKIIFTNKLIKFYRRKRVLVVTEDFVLPDKKKETKLIFYR